MRATAAGLGESEYNHLLNQDLDGLERYVIPAPLCHFLYVGAGLGERQGWEQFESLGLCTLRNWGEVGFSDSSILLQESAKRQGRNSSPPGKGDGGACFSHCSCPISSLSSQFPSGWGRQEDLEAS